MMLTLCKCIATLPQDQIVYVEGESRRLNNRSVACMVLFPCSMNVAISTGGGHGDVPIGIASVVLLGG